MAPDNTNQVALAQRLLDGLEDALTDLAGNPEAWITVADVLDACASAGVKFVEDSEGDASLAYYDHLTPEE